MGSTPFSTLLSFRRFATAKSSHMKRLSTGPQTRSVKAETSYSIRVVPARPTPLWSFNPWCLPDRGSVSV